MECKCGRRCWIVMALALRIASQSVVNKTRVALPVHAVIACSAVRAVSHHSEEISPRTDIAAATRSGSGQHRLRVCGVKRGKCDVRASARSQARLQPALLSQL